MSIVAFSLFYKMLPVVIAVCQHVENNHYTSHLPTLEKQRSSSCPSHQIHRQLPTIPSPSLFILTLFIEGQSKVLQIGLLIPGTVLNVFQVGVGLFAGMHLCDIRQVEGIGHDYKCPHFYNSGFQNSIHCLKRSTHN